MAEDVAMKLQFSLLGESGVGKTCLFKKFFNDVNVSPVSTIECEVKVKTIDMSHLGRDIKVKLSVWDTIGMEKFQALMPRFYRDTHGYIIVYDVTCRASFEALNKTFVNIDTFTTIDDYVAIVVGNKTDMEKERVVSRAEGLKYAVSKGTLFTEATAVTDESVDHIYKMLTSKALENSYLWTNAPKADLTLESPNSPPVKNNKCRC